MERNCFQKCSLHSHFSLSVPNEFSGQIVVEKEGFKEIHIIKDGKAIQKYNVRVYPDGREVSVDDEFAVLGMQDGQKVQKTRWPWHRVNREFGCSLFQTGKTQGI